MVIGLIGVLGYLPFFMIIMSVENIKCRLEKIGREETFRPTLLELRNDVNIPPLRLFQNMILKTVNSRFV